MLKVEQKLAQLHKFECRDLHSLYTVKGLSFCARREVYAACFRSEVLYFSEPRALMADN